jgi:hypothetical protein
LNQFVKAIEDLKLKEDIPYSTLRAVINDGNPLSKSRFRILANQVECEITQIASDQEQPKPQRRNVTNKNRTEFST